MLKVKDAKELGVGLADKTVGLAFEVAGTIEVRPPNLGGTRRRVGPVDVRPGHGQASQIRTQTHDEVGVDPRAIEIGYPDSLVSFKRDLPTIAKN